MSLKGNGAAKSWVLWLNTVLTMIAAFIGGRLWDKVDRINDTQIKNDTEFRDKLELLVEKQNSISREHHVIFQRLDKLDKLDKLKP